MTIGMIFNDAVLEHFNFTFQVSNKDCAHILDQQRLLIVANSLLNHIDPLKESIAKLNLSKKAIAERMRKQVCWLAKKKKIGNVILEVMCGQSEIKMLLRMGCYLRLTQVYSTVKEAPISIAVTQDCFT